MAIQDLRISNELKKLGKELGRAGLSELTIEAVAEFDGSYKGAMLLAGRLKAIALAANYDEYWKEKVAKGFYHQVDIMHKDKNK